MKWVLIDREEKITDNLFPAYERENTNYRQGKKKKRDGRFSTDVYASELEINSDTFPMKEKEREKKRERKRSINTNFMHWPMVLLIRREKMRENDFLFANLS